MAADAPYTDPLELYGSYEWDPEGGMHNAVWSGTLALEEKCLYLDLSPQTVPDMPLGDTEVRSFMRLPGLLTSYAPASGELWVDGQGPMSNGDDVVVVGSQGWQMEWNAEEDDGMHHFAYDWDRMQGCPAHVSFWTASMVPAATAISETLAAAVTSVDLAGLFEWDVEIPDNLEGPSGGVLVVEEPCLFLDGFTHFGLDDEWEARWEDRLYLLKLPRALVRFEGNSDSVWVRDYGPMTTGDEVLVGSGTIHDSANGWELYEGACQAQGTFRTTAMRPRE